MIGARFWEEFIEAIERLKQVGGISGKDSNKRERSTSKEVEISMIPEYGSKLPPKVCDTRIDYREFTNILFCLGFTKYLG